MILAREAPVHTWAGKVNRATTPVTMQVGLPIDSGGLITSLQKGYRVEDKPNACERTQPLRAVTAVCPAGLERRAIKRRSRRAFGRLLAIGMQKARKHECAVAVDRLLAHYSD